MIELPFSSDLWLQAIVGVVLLLLGQRLFWLCVAAAGFLFTFSFIAQLRLDLAPEWSLLLALALAIAGAVLAVFLQRVAVAVAGFFFGAYVALQLIDAYGLALGDLQWMIVIGAAVLTAVLAVGLLAITLIVLSSLVGAALVTVASGLGEPVSGILFLVLTLLGIAFQTRFRGRTRSKR